MANACFRRGTLAKLIVLFRHSKTNFSIMSENVHETAKSGFVDGDNYDQFRPTYTDEVVKVIASIITDRQTYKEGDLQYDCVELGAGTGKLTKKLLNELPESSRSRYLATEPMDGFLQTLKRNCPGLSNTKVCSADNIPVPTEKVKTVVAAQCFHWFANTASINEIHRILTPSGKFIMVWNNKDKKVPWIKDMGDILTRYYGDTPRFFSGKWKTFLESCPQFRCVRHDILPGFCPQWHYEDVIGHYCSISVVASLDNDEKERVKQEMRTVMDKHGLISEEHKVVVPFYTELYVTEKVKSD
uniref:Uncharacterized methyltransferase-like C25B8.10 n=1 Tax=Crassostrea virginica TaxID=6565 RepID=A0A8B8APK9_CRAVI|nr:uncharacterized methyltransferase-like C25B8.10 [Crassostrea virginica]